MSPKLSEIAADMMREAARRPEMGLQLRELARGLVLEYTETGGCLLVLSRPAVKPSEREVAICRAAFGVPADAEREDGENTVGLRWPKPTIN